jgi:hypothetical protein
MAILRAWPHVSVEIYAHSGIRNRHALFRRPDGNFASGIAVAVGKLLRGVINDGQRRPRKNSQSAGVWVG